MMSTRQRIEEVRAAGRRWVRRSLRRYLVRTALLGLSSAVRLNPMARPSRHGIRMMANLRYRDAAGKFHTLDVFEPERVGRPMPVLLYVHGGGFSMLSKETHWGMAMAFARRGYLVFNINYRLAPKNRFPAALEDACAAYEWIVEHAPTFGGDLSRLVLAGESAGANLVTALSVATTFERTEPYAKRVFELGVVPKAVIPACGILQTTDVARLWRRKPLPSWLRAMLTDVSSGYLGAAGLEPSLALELADPLRVIESKTPSQRPLPAFFAPVGTRDVLLDDTRRLEKALADRGVTCEARYYPGEVHAFHAFLWRPLARQCWAEQFAFLAEHAPCQ